MSGDLLVTHPGSVLIPRFDAIGDLVLLSGFLASLREAWPEARLTLLVRREIAGLARLFPQELEWLGVEVAPAKVRPNLEDAVRLLEPVRERQWDLVVVSAFSCSWAEHVVAAGQGRGKRVSLAAWPDTASELRSVLRALRLPEASPYDGMVHAEKSSTEPEKYSLLLRAIAPGVSLRPPRLSVPEDVRTDAIQVLASHRLAPGHFAVVAPAGTQNVAIKAWPADRFVEMLVWLESRQALPALLVGHVSERARLEEIAATSRDRGAAPRIFLGDTQDLPLLGALIEQAALYFGNDTGSMHLAAALDVPVAGVFGGGTWPRFRPAARHSASAVGAMPCFGCDWDCAFEDAPCIRLVTVEDGRRAVLAALEPDGPADVIVPASTVLDPATSSLVSAAARQHRAASEERGLHVRMIEELQSLLKESEADRTARRQAMETLGRQLEESEADRTARRQAMETLGRKLEVSEADRTARLAAVEALSRQLEVSEADRAARLAAVEALGRQLEVSEADRTARLAAVEALGRQLEESEADRAARLAAMEALGRQLEVSEADRAARLAAMEALGRQLEESRANVRELNTNVRELEKLVGERDAVLSQLPVRLLMRLGIVRWPGRGRGGV